MRSASRFRIETGDEGCSEVERVSVERERSEYAPPVAAEDSILHPRCRNGKMREPRSENWMSVEYDRNGEECRGAGY